MFAPTKATTLIDIQDSIYEATRPTIPRMSTKHLTLLRRASLATLTQHADIHSAIHALGFVQADPIRAPARAQDLILRQRLSNYAAGDLEEAYARGELNEIEEDFFVNYGFMPHVEQAMLHPRHYAKQTRSERAAEHLVQPLLEFVRKKGATHPRDLVEHFGKISMRNYWGGSSQVTTGLMNSLHYRGHLRVARREQGIKVYERAAHLQHYYQRTSPRNDTKADLALAWPIVELILRLYEPLPFQSLTYLVRLSSYGAPQLQAPLRHLINELKNAPSQAVFADRIASHTVDDVRYFWRHRNDAPTLEKWCERVSSVITIEKRVRLLAPFDPVVWDRVRFELLHGWRYTFEAYVPAPKRTLGYYALPMLWGDRCVGWANLSVQNVRTKSRPARQLVAEVGYVNEPKSRAFHDALREEVDRINRFLHPEGVAP
jgi:uncharacterized protein